MELCALCGGLMKGRPEGICNACLEDLWDEVSPRDITPAGSPVSWIALADYGGMTRNLIEAVKFGGRRRPLQWVVQAFRRHLPEDGVTPCAIPASPRGRHHRGFDQMEVVARSLGGCRTPFRHRRGDEQKRLNRHRRQGNAERVLVLKRDPPAAPVLIDDVCTTGATMNRALHLCLRGGALPPAVYVLAAAQRLRY